MSARVLTADDVREAVARADAGIGLIACDACRGTGLADPAQDPHAVRQVTDDVRDLAASHEALRARVAELEVAHRCAENNERGNMCARCGGPFDPDAEADPSGLRYAAHRRKIDCIHHLRARVAEMEAAIANPPAVVERLIDEAVARETERCAQWADAYESDESASIAHYIRARATPPPQVKP